MIAHLNAPSPTRQILGLAPFWAQAAPVAELIQAADNLPLVNRWALPLSCCFTYHGGSWAMCIARPRQPCPRGRLVKGKIIMKLDFRQRLLTSTLLVGAGLLANPAYAQPVPTPNQPGTAQDT